MVIMGNNIYKKVVISLLLQRYEAFQFPGVLEGYEEGGRRFQ